jgi:hypothetical protein
LPKSPASIRKWIVQVVGAGAVASIVLDRVSFTLNQNTALVSGSLYEFAVHTDLDTTIEVTGGGIWAIYELPVVD